MKKILLSLIVFLFILSAFAQNWKELGFIGSGNTLTVDAAGNLYTAGLIKNANGYYYVGKWNGSKWQELGLGTSTLNANAPITIIYTDASGNLYAAGSFTNQPNGKGQVYVAKWDGTSWTQLNGYLMNQFGIISGINAIETDASGNVYVAGAFAASGPDFCVLKWDGTTWTNIGTSPAYASNFQGLINSMVFDKAGSLYVSGYIEKTTNTYYVAKWDGTSWSEVGTGTNVLNANAGIYSLAFDSHNNLYVAGFFKNATNVCYVAKWDGTNWSEVGTGTNALNANNGISTIAIDKFDNIYAGGIFTDENNGIYIAKWNGTTWARMGPGIIPLNPYGQILAITTDKISGDIYASGLWFIDSDNASYTVKWNPQVVSTGIVSENQRTITVYPNPFSSVIQLPAINEELELVVSDVTGKNVYRKKIMEGISTIDFSFLSTGIYTLTFTGQNFSYAPVKIIKE